jgi:hypothetical protein
MHTSVYGCHHPRVWTRICTYLGLLGAKRERERASERGGKMYIFFVSWIAQANDEVFLRSFINSHGRCIRPILYIYFNVLAPSLSFTTDLALQPPLSLSLAGNCD